MFTTSVFRLARAVVFAAVCVMLGIVGHVLASRASVSFTAVVWGFAGITVVAVVLAGRERSLATILTGLLGGQFALHALFAAAEHGQSPHGPVSAGTVHGGYIMTLAHVVAALVSAWWLRRGEHAIWVLARKIAAAGRRLRVLLVPPVLIEPSARLPVPVSAMLGRRVQVLRHVVSRRGPPSPSTALV